MLQAGAALVAVGVSVPDLAALAVRHARNVEAVVDEAVDLFLDAMGTDELTSSDLGNLTPLVEALVPQVVALVGEHFRRTLLSRAAVPVGGAGEMTPLEEFASWSGDDRVYWRAPGADAIAGLGAARAVEVDGRWRFEAAAAARC